MLRVQKIIIMLALLVLVPSVAVAASYTYSDIYKNWIGWGGNPEDNISNPLVGDMTITINGGYLSSIALQVESRLIWDTLFINTDWNGYLADYQSWNFYVIDGFVENNNAELYRVDKDYSYLTVSNPDYRVGHPSAIQTGLLGPGTATVRETYDGTTLLYEFTNVPITDRFVVGYSQFCANDVFLTPVPEPSTILLLGLGFAGFAWLRRRG
jgi:hypothetical protein